MTIQHPPHRQRYGLLGQHFVHVSIIILVAILILPSPCRGLSSSSTSSSSSRIMAPETSPLLLQSTQSILDQVYGRQDSDEWNSRRVQARESSNDMIEDRLLPAHELVYGELGLSALTTILDAVGVYDGDQFLDIGAGDGLLVMAAALLFPNHLTASRGIEIVPELYERSLKFQESLMGRISVKQQQQNQHKQQQSNDETATPIICPEVSLELGNVYKPGTSQQQAIFQEKTTLAVCFATTWSRGVAGRKLPQLSQALGVGGAAELPKGARLVMIDGVLNHVQDGFDYGGELKFSCPDTAPYSIARLYVKR